MGHAGVIIQVRTSHKLFMSILEIGDEHAHADMLPGMALEPGL